MNLTARPYRGATATVSAQVPGLVSVIVPCYNQARYVEACIESVHAQRGVDCEIIVVNDGSTDDSEARLRAYGEAIRYIAQPNAGLSNARNVGLRHARGEFIQFLDSDDLLGRDALVARVAALRARGGDVALCRNRLFTATDADGRPRDSGEWRLPGARFDVHLCHFNLAPPHAYLWRHALVARIGKFDEGLRACEDHDFALRALQAGARFLRVDGVRVHYRRHAASMSANHANQHRHDVILHGRVHAWLAATLQAAAGSGVARCLAHVAGVITSLGRAAVLAPDDVATLAGLLDEALGWLDAQRAVGGPLGGYYASLGLARLDAAISAGGVGSGAVARCRAPLLKHRGSPWRMLAAGGELDAYERLRWCKLRLVGG